MAVAKRQMPVVTLICFFFYAEGEDQQSNISFGWSALFAVCGAIVMCYGWYNETADVHFHFNVPVWVRTFATIWLWKLLTAHLTRQCGANDSLKCIVMEIMTGVAVIVLEGLSLFVVSFVQHSSFVLNLEKKKQQIHGIIVLAWPVTAHLWY